MHVFAQIVEEIFVVKKYSLSFLYSYISWSWFIKKVQVLM